MKNTVKYATLVAMVLGSVSAQAYLCSVNKDKTGCESKGCVSSKFPGRYCSSTRATAIAGVFVKSNCDDARDVKLEIKTELTRDQQIQANDLQRDLQTGVSRELGDVVSCDCEQ